MKTEAQRTRKILFGIGVIIVALAIGRLLFVSIGRSKTNGQYQFGEITRGDLENVVSSTGTISAVGTVEIGTQVSGTIDKIYADFNDRVKKGQLLAVLDTVLLKAAVLDAEAGYEQTKAQLEEAQANHERNLPLYENGFLSEAEYLPYKIQLVMKQASLKSAEASLQRAERNLRYAVIRSPINGTVLQRNIEEGQTVAASFQTPTLFLIAEDLSKMEIHAQVDESDIGLIKEGLPVRFTVLAYDDKTFPGTVRQIWLQPETIQNVVNYTVVIDAENDEGLLLPGMTATIDFIVEQKEDVLLVPTAALKIQPTQEMFETLRSRTQRRFGGARDSLRVRAQPPEGMAGGFTSDMLPQDQMKSEQSTFSMLWFLDDEGQLDMRPVRTGSTDGKFTEIAVGRDIREGMRVISGITQSSNTKSESSPRPPGGFGRRPF